MSAFVARFDDGSDAGAGGPRLAVKCSIDVAGAVTSAGSPILAEGPPADHDAVIVASARARGARIIGHTTMPEFGLTATGHNPWFPMPANPQDAGRLPGGSSSGSVVAVVTGEADAAYGTDAGGSLRIPPACCGAVGLKPTAGRVPAGGIRLLTPSLDVAGPIGADVAGCVLGMSLIEPGFSPAPDRDWTLARVRPGSDPGVDAAVDAHVTAAGVTVIERELPGLHEAYRAAAIVLLAESWATTGHLLAQPGRISPDIAAKLEFGRHVTSAQLGEAAAIRADFHRELELLLAEADAIVLPTIPVPVPSVDAGIEADVDLSRLTLPFNLTGHPALACPAPRSDGELPASVQLVGRWRSEEMLVAIAARLEG